jgi:hypothetical protein
LVIGVAVSSSARAREAPPDYEAPPADQPVLSEEPSPTDLPGLDASLRFGYVYPFGNVTAGSGNAMSDVLSGGGFFGLDLGFRINAYVTVGALVQYAFLAVKDSVCSSCSGSMTRLGGQVLLRIPVESSRVLPWLGLAAGYEWMSVSGSSSYGGGSASIGARGFELATLQGGVDLLGGPRASIGPFISVSIGRYDTATASFGANSESGDIADKDIHEWLQIGLKGTLTFSKK